MEETQAFHSARAPSASEAALRSTEPLEAALTPSGSRAGPGRSQEVTWRGQRGGGGGGGDTTRQQPRGLHPRPPFLPQDALWLQEVSNLSEWLSPDP